MSNTTIVLFTDLDDTLFQLQRHRSAGIYPATHTPTQQHISYQTVSQQLLFELFYQQNHVTIIPVTARSLRQYHNTFLSHLPRINIAVLYFGGLIWEENQPNPDWQHHVYHSFQQLSQSIQQLSSEIKQFLHVHQLKFTLNNTDGYYLTVRADAKTPASDQAALFQEMIGLSSGEYIHHYQRRNLVLLPKFIDKRYAVKFLLEKQGANLHLAMGDSLNDLSFMQLCDVRLIPKNTQIDTLLFNSNL
ncbi:HAD hydrolase family protein [Thioflexithrix psekupsensis]|nr:HAD hydrolase family protein [Thioflexithrix psekupsensis]